MPRISVIIPAYNPGPYLDFAIQSVIGQTVSDWEIILVDDGSPEDLSYVKERYPFVILLRQQNQGQSAARNAGIASAIGDFVAFLDQDDIWLPTKLERQIKMMEANKKLGLCHTQFEIVDRNRTKICDGFGRYQTYAEMLTGGGICGATSVMVRRGLLTSKPFRTVFEPAEDYDLWLRLARDYETAFVPSCEALYRQHETNQSRRYMNTYRAIIRILQSHLAEAETRGDIVAANAAKQGMQRIRPTYSGQAFDQARQSLHQRQPVPFVVHLYHAIRLSPQYMAGAALQKLRKVA